MSDEIISIAVDETQVTRGAEALTRELKKINASLKDLNQVIEVFDRKGQLTQVRFQGITQAGEKFAGVVNEFGSLFPKVWSNVDHLAESVKNVTQLTSRYEQAQRDATAAVKDAIKAQENFSREVEINLRERVKDAVEAEKAIARETEINLKERLKETVQNERAISRETETNLKERLKEIAESEKAQRVEQEANLREQLNELRKAGRERVRIEKETNREIQREREANIKEAARLIQLAATQNHALGGSIAQQLDAARAAGSADFAALRDAITGRHKFDADPWAKGAVAMDALGKATIRAAEGNNKWQAGLANLRTISSDFVETGKVGAKAGQDVLLSWHSVARLFAVQVLHQALAAIRLEMIQAARTSLEYANLLAQIRTISDDASESTRVWNRALLETGANLPFKQVDIARAAYQALSDQIIHTTADLGFLTQASDLAIIGVSSLETAVDVTSSTMNAFSLSMLRQHQISADLFRTVDLGRSTLDEIAENLGRVSILSSELGVSFREQQAALAALTIQGVRDDVAKTLLINVYNKLIRPSERMNEIFKEWGVSSGQAAISAFGLTGVMSKLNDIAGRSGDEVKEFGEIFQRVRATIGALGLDFDKLNSTIEQYTNSTAEFDKRLAEFQNSTANRLKTEFANVDRLFLRLGDSVNTGLLSVADLFGGLDEALKLVAHGVIDLGAVFIAVQSGKGIIGLISLFKLMKAEMALVASGAKTLGAAMSLIWGPIVAIGTIALTELISYQLRWRERIQETIDEATQDWDNYFDELNKKSLKSLEDWLDEVDATSRGVRGSIALVISEIRRMNDTLDVDLKQSFIELQDIARDFAITTTDALDAQIEAIKDNLKEAERIMREATAAIERDSKRVQDLNDEIDIRLAKRRNRGKSDQDLARDLEINVGTEDALEEALKINERIRDDTRRSAQERTTAASEAFRLEDEITLLKERQAILLNNEIANNNILAAQKQQEVNLLQLALQLEENAKNKFNQASDKFLDFDIENARKVAEEKNSVGGDASLKDQIDNEKKIRQSLLDEFNKLGSDFTSTARTAGADPTEILKIEAEIQKRRQEIIKDSEAEILRIRTDALQASLNAEQENINAKKLQAEKAISDARTALADAQKTSVQDLAALRGFLDAVGPSVVGGGLGGVGGGNSELATGIDNVRRLRQNKERLALIEDIKRAEEVEAEIAEARLNNIPDEERFNKLLKERQELLAGISTRVRDKSLIGTGIDTEIGGAGETGTQIAERIQNSVEGLQDVFGAEQEAVQALADVEESFRFLADQLASLGLDRNGELLRKNNAGLEALTGAMSDNITALGQLRAELEKRSGGLPGDRPQRPEEEKFFGGPVYGAGGIDNVPAWLTRGEYVINATAARENMPILTAINSGAANFNRGGSVKNINFNGGFNFNGNAGERATVERIWTEIQRRISRGVASIGNN